MGWRSSTPAVSKRTAEKPPWLAWLLYEPAPCPMKRRPRVPKPKLEGESGQTRGGSEVPRVWLAKARYEAVNKRRVDCLPCRPAIVPTIILLPLSPARPPHPLPTQQAQKNHAAHSTQEQHGREFQPAAGLYFQRVLQGKQDRKEKRQGSCLCPRVQFQLISSAGQLTSCPLHTPSCVFPVHCLRFS